MIRVAYLIHSLHIAGGKEMILTSKANWLCARPDMEVWIITSHMAGRKPFFPLDARVHLVDVGVNEGLFGRRYGKRLQRILTEIRPDVTVSMCGSDLFGMLKCRDTGSKVAENHFLHDKFFKKYSHNPLYARYRTRVQNAALAGCDALIVLSDYDLNYYRTVMPEPEKVYKIGNVTAASDGRRSDLGRKRFLCVGRLSPEKNFADAIRIWKIVCREHPDWHLDIYGDGKERKNLEKLIKSYALTGNVSLKGRSSAIMDEYADCSGLLVTSRYEGFGLIVVEAASCGVPVVAYSCPGGLCELVSDGTDGFLVGEGDIDAAAERTTRLIEDAELRRKMGSAAIEKTLRYRPESIMTKWVELFKNLTEGR